MIAGLVEFAAVTGAAVVAEGIETPAEAATVKRLGVGLGQGYLLGRPAAVEEWQLTTSHPAPDQRANPVRPVRTVQRPPRAARSRTAGDALARHPLTALP